MGIIPNVASNYRSGETEDEYLLDDLVRKQRFIIERTNARINSQLSSLSKT